MKGYILRNGRIEYCEDHLHKDWEDRKKERVANFRIENYYIYLSFAEGITYKQLETAYELAREYGAFIAIVDLWKNDKRVFSKEISIEDIWSLEEVTL
jgi:hypothetical protein